MHAHIHSIIVREYKSRRQGKDDDGVTVFSSSARLSTGSYLNACETIFSFDFAVFHRGSVVEVLSYL